MAVTGGDEAARMERIWLIWASVPGLGDFSLVSFTSLMVAVVDLSVLAELGRGGAAFIACDRRLIDWFPFVLVRLWSCLANDGGPALVLMLILPLPPRLVPPLTVVVLPPFLLLSRVPWDECELLRDTEADEPADLWPPRRDPLLRVDVLDELERTGLSG